MENDKYLHTRVDGDFKALVEKRASAAQMSVSEFIKQSLNEKIEGADNTSLILKKLNIIERNQQKQEQRTMMTISMLETFVRYFMITAPVLSDEEFKEANLSLERQFGLFVKESMESFLAGGLVVSEMDNVIKESIKKADK